LKTLKKRAHTRTHTNQQKQLLYAKNPSNSAAHSDTEDAQNAGDADFERAAHTNENSPSEAPKYPQSNSVDLPVGAVPRRKKESEP
jgi:hypothetical protein